jgi:colanic acid biosynthesis protein WcaH
MKQLTEQLADLLSFIGNPREGLPQEIFYFISQLTPMVNVDLLIKNNSGQTLLTWREDGFYGPGWHIPGGIIRFKETAEARIHKVANSELGITVCAESVPVIVSEIMAKHRDVRGHFISMLYRCALTKQPSPDLMACSGSLAKSGQWMWHDGCPDNLIEQHEIYRKFIEGSTE